LSLIVSPRLGPLDESAVITTVLEAMTGQGFGADAARKIWSQVGTLRVSRTEPVLTGRGKLMPLHVTKRV
jgi:hypothetical protein